MLQNMWLGLTFIEAPKQICVRRTLLLLGPCSAALGGTAQTLPQDITRLLSLQILIAVACSSDAQRSCSRLSRAVLVPEAIFLLSFCCLGSRPGDLYESSLLPWSSVDCAREPSSLLCS